MSDSFDEDIGHARAFLERLRQNNTRDWFQDHKAEYEQHVKLPGTRIARALEVELSQLVGGVMAHKLFRINRDVRFSKDKTPYNTHLHVLWSDGSGPGFFFGVSPEYVTAGCGVMGLQKELLDAYRSLVDKDGARVAREIERLTQAGYRLDAPELKRVPAPYAKDHAHGDLLRRKSLALWYDLDGEEVTIGRLMACYEALLPVYRFTQSISD